MNWSYLAEVALVQYNLGKTKWEFLGYRENVTFRIEARGGQEQAESVNRGEHTLFLLRIHHPVAQFRDDIWQRQEIIESELLWLTALRQDPNLVVPFPFLLRVRNKKDSFVTSVAMEGTSQRLNCTLVQWVDGRRHLVDAQPTAAQARSLEELVARLHQLTSFWELPGFV